jgi:hypothetical protein
MNNNALLIVGPSNYAPERFYVLKVIFNEFLGINYVYKEAPTAKCMEVRLADNPSKVLVWPDLFFQLETVKWLTPKSLPIEPLPMWHAKSDLPEVILANPSIPVIFGVNKGTWFRGNENKIELGVDITGSIFFILTRYEELVVAERDEHKRFPAKASLAYRAGFLDRPIVDEYIEILWACLKRLWPGLTRKEQRYRVWLSHDVDIPLCAVGRPWIMVIRRAGGDLVRRGNISLFARRVQSRLLNDPRFDPCNTFDFIMGISERYNLKSTFFFKAGHSNPLYDNNYSLEDPWIQTLMQRVYESGHEIGIHPSYEGYRDEKTLRLECERLRRVAESLGISQECWGSRQHYLRWENPVTWQICEESGVDYDSTLGFADHVGFRCGTGHEFPVFNLRTRSPLRLRERPLVAMDTTLLAPQYMALRPEQAIEWIERLSSTCRRFGGTFSLLWHNSNLIESWQRELYLKVLEAAVR